MAGADVIEVDAPDDAHPEPARRSTRASRSSTSKIAMYPPSPPRLSSSRPAVVPSLTGLTTSRNWSPTVISALCSPNSAMPGSS